MTKSLLIAVGGTGQHVALAYIDIVALAYRFIEYLNTSWPEFYILDADKSTESSGSAWDITLAMHKLLKELEGDKIVQTRTIPSFDENLNGTNFNESTQSQFKELLFNSDQRENTLFKNGYYGQASVGATIFGHTYRTLTAMQGTPLEILKNASMRNARIFIAGSSVGGTGAGCLPRLVESLSNNAESTTDIMTCVFLPWFRLESNEDQIKAEKRNSEMNERSSSGLLYFQNRLAKRSATLILGHPNPTQATARPWAGDARQPYYRDLTIPYYAAIAASNHFFSSGVSNKGIYCFVKPNQNENFTTPDIASTFGKDDEGIYFFRNLVDANVELCLRLAEIFTYWGWDIQERKPITTNSLSKKFKIDALENLRRDQNNLRILFNLKWNALKRYNITQRIDNPNYQILENFERANSIQIPNGLVGLRSRIPGNEGNLIDNIITRIRERKITIGASTSPLRCLPNKLSQESVTWDPLKVGTLDDITTDDRKKDYIEKEKIKPYAIPSVDSIAFILETFYGKYQNGAIVPGEKFPEGEIWADRAFLILKGVSCGEVSVKELTQEHNIQNSINLTIEYNSILSEEALLPDFQLTNQVGFYITYNNSEILIGITDPRVLILPSHSVDWGKIEKIIDASHYIHGGDAYKVLKGWLNFLKDLSPLGVPLPGWFEYFYNREEIRTALFANYAFHFITPISNNGNLFKVKWPELNNGVTLYLPKIGEQNQHVRENQIKNFGFQIENNEPNINQLGYQKYLNIKSFLQDRTKCVPFTYFYGLEKGKSEERLALWEDIFINSPNDLIIISSIKFGYLLVSQNNIKVAYKINIPDDKKLMIFQSPADVEVPEIVVLGDRLNPENKVFPDFPVKIEFVDLIDLTVTRVPSQISNSSITFNYRLKGRQQNVTATMIYDQRDMRGSTVLLWPSFKAIGWQSYYALTSFKEIKAKIDFIIENEDSNLTHIIETQNSQSAQPLYYDDILKKEFHGGVPKVFSYITEAECKEKDCFEKGSGLFLIDFTTIAPSQTIDNWGIDFGTSNSVCAVKGNINGSKVISCDGLFDQTKEIIKLKDTRIDDWYWFSTRNSDGLKPQAPENKLFPSQMISLSNERGFENLSGNIHKMKYKKDYTITSPDLPEQADLKKILSERQSPFFKWSEGSGLIEKEKNRCLRKAYLIHLLELCLALRFKMNDTQLGINPSLPQQINACFSLPIRMYKQFSQFRDDINEVTEIIKNMTGVTFKNSFQWESLAGKVSSAGIKDEIYIVGDLGGGSFDLWGGYSDGTQFTYEWAESFLFGGQDLLEQIDRDCNLKDDKSVTKQIRCNLEYVHEQIKNCPDAIKTMLGFFELAKDTLSRWIASIVVNVYNLTPKEEYKVNLTFLGMGWSVDYNIIDCFNDRIDSIQERCNNILNSEDFKTDVIIKTTDKVISSWVDKKTYIAQNLSIVGGNPQNMEKNRPKTLLLTTLKDGPLEKGDLIIDGYKYNSIKWHYELPQNVKINIKYHYKEGYQCIPELEFHKFDQQDTDIMINDLNKILNETDGKTKKLEISPFRLIIERLRQNSKKSR